MIPVLLYAGTTRTDIYPDGHTGFICDHTSTQFRGCTFYDARRSGAGWKGIRVIDKNTVDVVAFDYGTNGRCSTGNIQLKEYLTNEQCPDYKLHEFPGSIVQDGGHGKVKLYGFEDVSEDFFAGMFGMEDVEFDNNRYNEIAHVNMEKFHKGAFRDCKALKTLTVPKTVWETGRHLWPKALPPLPFPLQRKTATTLLLRGNCAETHSKGREAVAV